MPGGPTALDLAQGVDWSNKRIFITGANAGIGVETARAFAATGAEVFMACRTRRTAESTRQDILRTHPQARVTLLELDLGDLDSVEACAAAYPHETLDRLVCNAGVWAGDFSTTAQGLELTVGVCHFGHFLLFERLRERLQAAGQSRVVMVSSESHRTPKRLDFDNFPMSPERYRNMFAYGQAKLCNALMAAEIQRRHAPGIEACSLHPGAMIPTDIGRNSLLARVAMAVWRPFAKTVGQGAATTVYCTLTDRIDGGGYYRDCAPSRATDEARSPEVAKRLWELTETRLRSLGYEL